MSHPAFSRSDLARALYDRGSPPGRAPRVVVALPARDEAERIEPCLAALLHQRGPSIGADGAGFGIVLLANNCRDATVPRARDMLGAAGIPHLVVPIDLPPRLANAGVARGLALDIASLWAARAEGPGMLLTTDADSRVSPHWVEGNLSGLSGACGAVAGRFAFDSAEESDWPPHLLRRRRIESAYEETLAALSAQLDPLPHDPWPNHWTESGASFALTLDAYRRIGGLPAVEAGEDRALAGALVRHDIAIRHDPAIVVTTSARFDGRAPGGCASALLQRAAEHDAPGDERLEALPAALRRMVLRGRMRKAFSVDFCPEEWERRLRLDEGALAGQSRPRFGESWAIALARSPLLVPRPLRPAQMEHHLAVARRVRAALAGASRCGEEIEPIILRALPRNELEPLAESVDEALDGLVA
ncbi:glycosyltransferase [Ancylobacter sp. G4_0304]|uniref:glycosyltransferase n=1 Tax=Ancylobacter sp. G4_0304 TaxID=3114289 RepID=UPI0039C68953